MHSFWYWSVHSVLLAAVVWSGFDAAAISLAIIIGIFCNLGESVSGISAYSIFNKGCQFLLGDSRAEAVDIELRGGAAIPSGRASGSVSPDYWNIPSKFINRECPCGSGLKAKKCHAMRRERIRKKSGSHISSEKEDYSGFEVVA